MQKQLAMYSLHCSKKFGTGPKLVLCITTAIQSAHLSRGFEGCTRAILHCTLQVDGATALHVASRKGDLEVVELLLANWANPNIRDKVKTV